MKILAALIAIFVIAVFGTLFYGHRKTAELELKLADMQRDRDTMQSELSTLKREVTKQEERIAASVVERQRSHASAVQAVKPAVSEEPVATPGVSVTAPAGWSKNGSKPGAYVVGVDELQKWGGMPSAYVRSLDAAGDGFGGMMQTTAAESYIGKRVRLSGWIKTEDANNGGGHLWLRVDGQQSGQSLQFDNMNNRAVKGTSDWQEASVVLDVPPNASALAYGFFIQGGGKMWVSGTRIEEVGPEVPSTNMTVARTLPKAPRNLGFSSEPVR